MLTALAQHRIRAAEASGGTSNAVIKSFVLDLIRRHGLRGNYLDFGAGKGELSRLLRCEAGTNAVCGADILERPPDLPADVEWFQQDLNSDFVVDREFDVVICSEVIEHLENPRQVFRTIHRLLRPNGELLLTMPNQESIRSYAGLIVGGHFTLFLGRCYPAHITALLRLDLVRICDETGFTAPSFYYSGYGGIPKLPQITWQRISSGLLRGRLFSDNVAMISRKISSP